MLALVLAALSGISAPIAQDKPWQLAILWPNSWDVDYRAVYPDHAMCSGAKPILAAALATDAKRGHGEDKVRDAFLVCVEVDPNPRS